MSAPDVKDRRTDLDIGLVEPILRIGVAPFHHERETVNRLLVDHFGLRLPNPGYFETAGEIAVVWTDSRSWWIEKAIDGQGGDAAFLDEVRRLLRGAASIVDRSHGLTALRVGGPRARDLLAKGCALDLHPRGFGIGRCAATEIAHAWTHLRQLAADDFLLLTPRSYAEDLLAWTERAARSLRLVS